MKKTHMIIILIVLTMFVPIHSSTTTFRVQTDVLTNSTSHQSTAISLIGEELQMTETVLQFEDELTSDEISYARSQGVYFKERESHPIHVGVVYLATIQDEHALAALYKIGLDQASLASKQYYPSLESAVETLNASDVWNSLTQDGLPIDGTGVSVAVIDTGINWQHPSFWRVSSEEIDVILYAGDFYVDFDGDSIGDPNEGPIDSVLHQNLYNFSYGADYMFIDLGGDGVFSYADGDRWLGGVDANQNGKISLPFENVVILGESKVAILYDQENGDVYVRGVNLTTQALSVGDYHGHGSHVASTIAGGQVGFTGRVGVAPNADLIIVRSLLDSGDIVDAIHFAIENDADIINMSFSSYLGFLDGTDIEDLVITEAFIQHGTICTLAAGNLGGKSKHSSFSVSTASSIDVGFSVGSPPAYSFINVLWNSDDKDESIILTTPSEDTVVLGPFKDLEGSAFRAETDEIIANVFCDVSFRNTSRIIIQITDDQIIAAGHWVLSVENPSGSDVFVDVYVWDNDWSYNGLRLTTNIDNSRTISSPATSDFGIAVTAYSETSKSISSSSSQGPRIDGIPKPEVTAPGVSITAASRSLTGIWSTRSGTSMASPQVAGVLALIRSVTKSETGWIDYSALIQGAGGPNNHNAIATSFFGYGLCDALWSVQHVLEHNFNSSTSLLDWTGIDSFIYDGVDLSLDPSLDIISIRILQQVSNNYFAIEFSGVPNITDTDVLQLLWDVDDNLSTGLDGIDLLVNLTDGFGSIYEWSGSAYSLSSENASWWIFGKTIFLNLLKNNQSDRGAISFKTFSATELADDTLANHLTNQWRPLLSSVSILKPYTTTYDVLISITDQDSFSDSLSLSWSYFEGGYNIIHEDSIYGVSIATIRVNFTGHDGLLGILLEVTDENGVLKYPPIILSDGLSINQNILSAVINEDVVSVGLFSSGMITGSVKIDGYLLVDRLYLALESEFGFWVNFTISGSNGDYPISIVLSGFTAGEYAIHVVAINLIGKVTTHYIKTIDVLDDNSLILLGGIGLGAIILIGVVLPRIRNKGDSG